MKIGEIRQMSLLGMAISKRDKKDADKTVYVEYHRCDQCGAEYRVYLHSPKEVEEAFRDLSRMMGNKPEEEDLCFNCQSRVIADQSIMPLEVGSDGR